MLPESIPWCQGELGSFGGHCSGCQQHGGAPCFFFFPGGCSLVTFQLLSRQQCGLLELMPGCSQPAPV